MRKEFTIGILSLALTLGLMTTVTAQSQDAEVNVTVSSVTQLDARPTELAYSGLEPGDTATASDEANGYSSVEVENIGSDAISTIYAETSQPTTDPFGTGAVSNYDSGNFLTLSTATAQSSTYDGESWQSSVAAGDSTNPHYVNRIEFSDEPVPTYIDTTTNADEVGFSPSGDLANSVGRFREGNEWYFYTVYYDDGGQYCDGSNSAELWVGTEAHTPSTLGTTDFTNATENANVDTYTISSAEGNVGVADSSVSLDSSNGLIYPDVYTYCDDNNPSDSHTLRSRFNIEPEMETAGVNQTDSDSSTTPLFEESDSSSRLEPGAHFPVDVSVQLPQGVVADDVNEGRLTLLAQSSP